MTARRLALEIAVASPAGARASREARADRVELCVALELGGLTPSQGLIESAVAVGIPVHVLIRPRPGDFVFSADEVDLMERETRAAVSSGAAGVVVGALDAGGVVDEATLARLVDVARDLSPSIEVTMHRAIDQSSDPVAAAARLAGLGITRLLSSGGASRAADGRTTLAAMKREAGPVQVMAGGGVDLSEIASLVAAGVDAVHLSAKKSAPRAGGAWVALGAGTESASADSHFVTDAATAEEARRLLDQLDA